MDLQSKLSDVARYFFKEKVSVCNVYIHDPSDENLFRFCVIITVVLNNKQFKGSSSSLNLFDSFLKALCELGENVILETNNIANRSGIAGGLVKRKIIERAKAELIERDAFLYHYRNLKKFRKSSHDDNKVLCFELNSIDLHYKVSLVMNKDYLDSPEKCLLLGVSSNRDFVAATERAYCEYSGMFFNHAKFISCSDDKNKSEFKKLTDFHHQHSRSSENKHILSNICFGKEDFEKRSYNQDLWEIQYLPSPLKFFSYVIANHPELQKLEFGHPESFQFEKPVYHPYW